MRMGTLIDGAEHGVEAMVRWIVRIICVIVIAALAAGLAIGREGRLRVVLAVRTFLADSGATSLAPPKAAGSSTNLPDSGEPTAAPEISPPADDLDSLLGTPLASDEPGDGSVSATVAGAAGDTPPPTIEPLASDPSTSDSAPSEPLASDDASPATHPSEGVRSVLKPVVDPGTADGTPATAARSPEQDAAFARLMAEARARQEELDKKKRRQTVRGNQPPNLLLVVIEDLSREDLGVYGQPLIQTPVLDSLAGEGVRLARLAGSSHGHAVERASLWYGDVPSERMAGATSIIRLPRMSLPELLANSGYRTCLLGDCSWPVVSDAKRGGWTHWFGWSNSGKSTFSLYPTQVESDGRVLHVVENAADRAVRFERLLLDDVDRFLGSQSEPRPVAIVAVARINWWADAKVVHPAYRDADWTDAERIHASAVTVADRLVGELRDRLEAFGERSRTVALVVGLPRPRSADLPRFRDAAAGVDTGPSTRRAWPWAPLIVAWPDTLPASQVLSGFSGLQDILPTLADLIGAAKPVSGGQGLSRWNEWREPSP